MKRILILILATVMLAVPAFANQYGWSISSSNTVPDANVGGVPSGGLGHLYLWYTCSTGGGMSAADFGLQANAITFAGFAPLNGFLNAGSGVNFLLAVGGCPTGPMVAGDLTVFYFGGAASMCLVNSNNGIRVTVDCASPTPSAWNLNATGWDALAAPSCTEILCGPTAVEPQGWGSVKSLYR